MGKLIAAGATAVLLLTLGAFITEPATALEPAETPNIRRSSSPWPWISGVAFVAIVYVLGKLIFITTFFVTRRFQKV